MTVLGQILSTADMNNANTTNAETAGATVTIDLSIAAKVRTWTAGQNETVNLTGSQTAGRELILVIANDATLGRVITFGTGFITLGVATGVISKTSMIHLVSNGTNFLEIARTIGI